MEITMKDNTQRILWNCEEWSEKSECYGCRGCEQICPVGAIKMRPDDLGFLYPQIDEILCLSCGKCEEACPIRHLTLISDLDIKSYRCQNKNDIVLKASSSGGVFTALAEYCLEQGGVVFGAAYDKELRVNHMWIDNRTDLDCLRRSKYVQSDLKNTYTEAGRFLTDGRMVLFTGMPCQIAGLYRYLQAAGIPKANQEQLFTMDMICGSVCSPQVFEDWKKELERQNGSKLISVNHREKEGLKWSDWASLYCFRNGKKVIKKWWEDAYKQGFCNELYSRKSCLRCGYKKMNSHSDVMVGDMIQWNKTYTKQEEKGASFVIVKSKKAKDILKRIGRNFIYEQIGLEEISEKVMIFNQFREHPQKEQFLEEYLKKEYCSLEDLIWKYLTVSHEANIEKLNLRFGVFGSYNVRAILRKLTDDRFCNRMSWHISKTSLVSQYATKKMDESILEDFVLQNKFRREMLECDLTGEYSKNMVNYLKNMDLLFIDFLEEASDILKVYWKEKEIYLTNSDVWREYNQKIGRDSFIHTVVIGEDEREKLWENACLQWIKELKRTIIPERIFLFELYLMPVKGYNGIKIQKFEEIEKIQSINRRLAHCYQFFSAHFSNIHIIQLTEEAWQYTDLMHRFGCIPEHLNEEAYQQLSKKVIKILCNC